MQDLSSNIIPTHIKGYAFENGTLRLVEKPLRELSDDEVLLKTTAIGINPVDFKVIKGNNQIIGVDGVGIAIATKQSIMDKETLSCPTIKLNSTYAYHCDLNLDGSFADFIIIKAKALIPLPDYISDTLGASLPCPMLTAMQSLQKVPTLQGQDVLVSGCGSMVGKILASLLILQGARVYASASRIHHKDLIDIGVLQCFDYDEKIKSKFKAIFDTTGKADDLLENLAYYGHIVAILGRIEHNKITSFTTCPSLHEIALGAIHTYGTSKDFSQLISNALEGFSLVAKGRILLPKIEVIGFSEIPNALNILKNGIKGVKFVAKMQKTNKPKNNTNELEIGLKR